MCPSRQWDASTPVMHFPPLPSPLTASLLKLVVSLPGWGKKRVSQEMFAAFSASPCERKERELSGRPLLAPLSYLPSRTCSSNWEMQFLWQSIKIFTLQKIFCWKLTLSAPFLRLGGCSWSWGLNSCFLRRPHGLSILPIKEKALNLVSVLVLKHSTRPENKH